MTEYLEDFGPGPLEPYRKAASFDWKKMKLLLDSEEVIKHEKYLYDQIRASPQLFEDSENSLQEKRHHCLKNMLIYRAIEPADSTFTKKHMATQRIYLQVCPATTVKSYVTFAMFTSTIRLAGTSRHKHYIEENAKSNILGCYCLTEIGHGSNTKGMQTTATFDETTKSFILHTPDFMAAKCWAGNLAKTATHAVVFAQLITKGKKHGLHIFVLQIRDMNTLKPLPGIIIGDLGEKDGLSGVDNGFMLFDHHSVPRESLLNAIGDVSEDGEYQSPYENPDQRHSILLEGLLHGRALIANGSMSFCTSALTTAIRYSSVRKQFGPNGTEVPILEYQSQQYRLLTNLSFVYALRIFNNFLVPLQYQFIYDNANKTDKKYRYEMSLELQAILSGLKSISAWMTTNVIQSCRESCGGFGYLAASGFGDLRQTADASCIYEGDAHVLIQQPCQYLLKFWPKILQGQKISTPLDSAGFLTDALNILKNKSTAVNIEGVTSIDYILSAYQWLICYLLRASYEKFVKNQEGGKNAFWARNEIVVFYAKDLSCAYIHHYVLQRMLVVINETRERSLRNVLTNLFSLYGLWTLEKHLDVFYEGGFGNGEQFGMLHQEGILQLCASLKHDAIPLVDAIAPRDFIFKTPLGASDGQVYKRLEQLLMSNLGNF